VIDALSAALAEMFERRTECPVYFDDDGCLRVIRNVTDYDGLVGGAFNQIRQAGSGMPAILIRMIEAVERLAPVIRDGRQIKALLDQLDMILADAENSVTIPQDLASVRDRYHTARRRVAGALTVP
jgi:uncharacterized membrane protein